MASRYPVADSLQRRFELLALRGRYSTRQTTQRCFAWGYSRTFNDRLITGPSAGYRSARITDTPTRVQRLNESKTTDSRQITMYTAATRRISVPRAWRDSNRTETRSAHLVGLESSARSLLTSVRHTSGRGGIRTEWRHSRPAALRAVPGCDSPGSNPVPVQSPFRYAHRFSARAWREIGRASCRERV